MYNYIVYMCICLTMLLQICKISVYINIIVTFSYSWVEWFIDLFKISGYMHA